MDYKYTLIVSQYYHSRHMIIVKHNKDTFIEQAKSFVEELEKYKRGEKQKEIYYGDLTYHKTDKIYPRYNINDAGDIYFINSYYANYCKDEAFDYLQDTIRQSKGYIRKQITEDISKHHNKQQVFDIVKKYFEIA